MQVKMGRVQNLFSVMGEARAEKMETGDIKTGEVEKSQEEVQKTL